LALRRLPAHLRFRLAYAVLAAVAVGSVFALFLLLAQPSQKRLAGGCDTASARWRAGATDRPPPTAGLLEVAATGGLVRPLAIESSGLDHPVYSPDGRRIALITRSNGIQGEIAICNLARGETRRLTLGVAAGDFPLSWLPDGKSLVYLGGDVIGYGASQHPLLVDVQTRKVKTIAGEAPWYWDGAVLSPDGRKLGLLLQLKYGAGEPERLDVFDTRTQKLVRVAGSRQFDEIDALSWSPDGRFIAFSAYRGNERGNLYVVDVETRRASLLLGNRAGQRDPAWSPDGKRIAFVRPARGNARQTSIWTVDLESGRTTQLTSGHVDVSPSWSRDGTKVVFVRRGPSPL
jgi:Tol biopolymer transport system component